MKSATLALITGFYIAGHAFAQIAPHAGAVAATPLSSACSPAVFLTLEKGRLVGVDWVERHGNQVHSHVVLMQSRVIDATIDLRPDETAMHSSVVLSEAGGDQHMTSVRDLEAGATYWSDMIVSSIEQVVARARALGGDQPETKVKTANLYRKAPGEAAVERLDATDWVVSVNNKDYLVLTDQHGCMLSASLPEHGTVIERRSSFDPSQYPLWPPYAAPPDGAYLAVDVSISAPQGHVLAGTLTTPKGAPGNLPAAVLITGLSPSERNGGQPPWMPLRDLADALTRVGIVVLRVDDRGIGKSSGDHKPSTTFDEANDVRAEIAWLRSQPGIDPKRIALIGYSEGGLIAPMVAAGDPEIAAIVTLDGPGTSGTDLARYQSSQFVLRDPSVPPLQRADAIEKRLADDLKDLTPRERVVLTIDPISYAQRVRCPALIVHGGSDRTVPMRSAERLANAMRSNGNTNVTVLFFPGVSHSLLPDPDGLSTGWVFLPGFLTDPSLLHVMSQWAASTLGVASANK